MRVRWRSQDSTSELRGSSVTVEEPLTPGFVRVVTDSTACLPSTPDSGFGPAVVPLSVIARDGAKLDGSELTSQQAASLLRTGAKLTTSQPSSEAFGVIFHHEPDVSSIVAVLLSSQISGTIDGARLAAKRVDVPIQVVDSRTTAMALGFAALEAGRCAAAGYDALHVSDRAQQVAGSATALFLVDSLKHLRSGGRISAGAAAFGTALGMKPILHMQDGRIQLLQRARTKNVALDKMVATAASAATKLVNPVLAVHHFGAEQDAIDKLIQKLLEATGLTPTVSELSAVLGTHVGPGALAIVVADLGQHSHN